ncbi:D-methionine transport system ATP-binding protein [Paenibacillus anaericanus]|uniref:methionine ABC transporter ATP-binding protein n=1 Tax=Paenibacillus anaericanus TaxID=170367 RepID=UPI002788DD7E|nr:ATP-binding cassette domain-containing protein [Paenibacillus anaericanus]MDQ0091394.1 D-methionine transport system ATP-binding protein [Paenibacillus anaericanus]
MSGEESFIQMKQVTKSFYKDTLAIEVLKDVNLEVDKGDIFGIIGYSGAGKSTLIRCINGIESLTSGEVIIDKQIVSNLTGKELRGFRRQVGMIFQQFNLMASRTVYGNIALALRNSGLSKQHKEERIMDLLELVDIRDKRDAYPSQLSGGQKQRVAIARALANHPKVLLCDEATSALDPQTTKSILQFLKDLNRKLGITIVMITHEMGVVKEICNKVAIIDQGVILEQGDVFSVFSNPREPLTKTFLETTSNLSKVDELIRVNSPLVQLEEGQVILKLTYTKTTVSEALISEVSRRFYVDFNIIASDIEIVNDMLLGGLVAVLSGEQASINQTLIYLHQKNVAVEVIRDARSSDQQIAAECV